MGGSLTSLKPQGRFFVLTIGINEYPDLGKECWSAEQGANAIEELLCKNYGFEAIKAFPEGETVASPLRGKRATQRSIRDVLSNLEENDTRKAEIREEDSLIIYLAGEGGISQNSDLSLERRVFFATQDTRKDDPDRFITYEDLRKHIKKIPARHILLISDHCYSGAAAAPVARRESSPTEAQSKHSRIILSSGLDEETDDVGRNGFSTFTGCLLEVLKDNKNRVLRASQLFDLYHDEVQKKTGQRPAFRDLQDAGGHPEGEFIFFLNEELAKKSFGDRLYDNSQLIHSHLKHFCGRNFVFDHFKKFRSENDSGYFVVEGEPGIGKTAIASKLTTLLPCVSHFNSAIQGITTQFDFLVSIVNQLESQHGIILPKPNEKDARNGDFLNNVLSKSSSDLKDGLVLLVDALDEYQLENDSSNLMYFPYYLPDHVYVFATTRSKYEKKLYVDNLEACKIDPQSENNKSDILEFIKLQIQTEIIQKRLIEQSGLSERETISILMEKSECNFVYLTQLFKAASKGDFENGELKSIPQGLTEYYQRHWSKIKDSVPGSFDDIYLPIIGGLAAAQAPMAKSDLVNTTRLAPNKVNQALQLWQEFLHISIDPDSGSKQFRLYHKSFQDFISEQIDPGLAAHTNMIGLGLFEEVYGNAE